MFEILGIAVNVDCERDMREMFLWYQKYLDKKSREERRQLLAGCDL